MVGANNTVTDVFCTLNLTHLLIQVLIIEGKRPILSLKSAHDMERLWAISMLPVYIPDIKKPDRSPGSGSRARKCYKGVIPPPVIQVRMKGKCRSVILTADS